MPVVRSVTMADAETAGRVCAFCGGPADSRQHLLPAWLQTVLPSEEAGLHYREVGLVSGDRREWESRPFREVARVVCDSCNTGWMARLESEARPILEPLITRADVLPMTMSEADQFVATRWALQTCLVLQSSFEPSGAPNPMAATHLFSDVMDGQNLPEQATVWIGSHARARQDPLNSVFLQKPLSLEALHQNYPSADEFGFVNFLAVGGVSFLVVGHDYRNRIVMTCREPLSDALVKIWPPEKSVVVVPPPLMMDQEFIDLLFDAGIEPPILEVQVFRA
jgi:hypothetical protein